MLGSSGTAKVAQKNKLANDALKLRWVASWLNPKPERLIICVSDENAVRHLRGRSWQSKAIVNAGVDRSRFVTVVGLVWPDVRRTAVLDPALDRKLAIRQRPPLRRFNTIKGAPAARSRPSFPVVNWYDNQYSQASRIRRRDTAGLVRRGGRPMEA